jgi:hypothetical protein
MSGSFRDHRLRAPAIVLGLAAVAVLVAAAPALVNDFPLVFWDSNVYVATLRHQWLGMPPFYSLFVNFVARVGGLQMLPLVQASLTVATLWLSFQLLAPSARPIARAIGVLTMVSATQLPWLASWIMPDLFGGLGAVAVIALLLARVAPSWQQWIPLSLIAFFAALSATANILVLAPLAVLCLLVRRFWLSERTKMREVAAVAVLITASVALPVLWNTIRYDAPRLNVAASALLFSKFADAGLAQRYLREECPTLAHPVCAHLDELAEVPGSQAFLWEGDPPLAEALDAWHDRDGVFAAIVASIARTYPVDVLGLAIADTVALAERRTLGFDAGKSGELQPFRADDDPRRAVANFHPAELPAFDAARQQRGNLQRFYAERMYNWLTLITYAGLIVVLTRSLYFGRRTDAAIALVLSAAILGGLLVHGGLVGPYARYHVKLSWIAAFALATFALRTSEARRPRTPPAQHRLSLNE